MTKKKEAEETPPVDKGPSLNDIVIEALNQTGGTARLKDVEKFAREKYESMGKAIANSFSGRVWHSLQRVAHKETGTAGVYTLGAPVDIEEVKP